MATDQRYPQSLFVCGTPLQSIIASRIIETLQLEKENCKLFFYTRVHNKKYEHYYEKLKQNCSESIYFQNEFRYPSYLIEAKRIFENLSYDDIYFASIISSNVFLALSLGKHQRIFTFDDGTANISPTSSYADRYGLTLKKYLGLRVFGNKYSAQKIRSEVSRHYTIYPGLKNNVSDRLVPIELFGAVDGRATRPPCAIILGTVFREAFSSRDRDGVIRKLEKFSETFTEEIYYLPHPRSDQLTLGACTTIDSPLVAEDVVLDLLTKHEQVNLYGFCSSCQINLAHLSEVNNFFLSVTGQSDLVQQMFALVETIGLSADGLIDLDEF